MKKIVALVLALCMVFALAACGSSTTAETAATEAPVATAEPTPEPTPEPTEEPAEPVELIVFAAASMTETLTEIADNYMAENPNVTITLNFDSSGTLKTQIQEGADCDVFISAGQKQMNQLDAAKDAEGGNVDGLDFVISDTRVNLLENKVALCVADNSNSGITTYDEMAEALKAGTITLAMGNSDVPVGQYTQKILAYYELATKNDDGTYTIDPAVEANISYGSNVKEVTTQVSEGTVDCGVIYATDAFSAGLTVSDTATKDMCGQVIYPAAVMKSTTNQEAAQAFLDYLFTDESVAVLEAVGFSPIAK